MVTRFPPPYRHASGAPHLVDRDSRRHRSRIVAVRSVCRIYPVASSVHQLGTKPQPTLYLRSTSGSIFPCNSATLSIMPSTTIESAAVDGRARTPRFIQRQLANLHEAITANAKTIQDAIIADTNIRSREAQLEIHLTIRVVEDLYDNFSVQKALSKEYRIARGEDSRDRTDAFGIIYLRPQSHNLVYSIITPLANAIAAGNCVVIEVKQLKSVFWQC
jgi:hypothetical protein